MSRPQRYLTRMALFLAIVIVIAAVLYPVLARAFLVNPALNGLILGVLLLGILYIFRQVLMLRPEVAWIERFQSNRPAAHEQQDPVLLAPMARMLGERKGRFSLSAPAMRSLLDGIGARLDEGRELSRYLIGLLIFLGLLGTFWGLIKTIGSVADVISGLSATTGDGDVGAMFSDLQEGIAGPLSGMGTAFSSSLFGLAGSLVLGFLDLQAGQAMNRFYTDLEDWLSGVTRLSSGVGIESEHSVPAYLQALLEQTAENIESLQRTVAQSEEGRRSANQNLLALTEKLSTLTDQMRTEQTLMLRLAESQVELRPILQRLSDAFTGDQGFGMDDATRQHIRNMDVYTARLLEEAVTGRAQAVQEIRSEIKLLARTIAALAEETDR